MKNYFSHRGSRCKTGFPDFHIFGGPLDRTADRGTKSYSKASECQNTAYFDYFLDSSAASVGK
jgi:hypothetical protein